MELQQERPPPPAYAQHDPKTVSSLPSETPSSDADRLPGIRSLDLPNASTSASPRIYTSHTDNRNRSRSRFDHLRQWQSLPPLNGTMPPRTNEHSYRQPSEADAGSPMDTASIASAQDDGGHRRAPSAVSIEDPEVRLAAEALSGLGNPGLLRSPTRSLTMSNSPPTASEPAPLLSLITSNHPWLGGTINGSISAYNATKGYSPRFVQYGAELIERNIGSPVVNTVSSVGRRTGVEKNLRRYLGDQGRRLSDVDETDSARKRPRVMSPMADSMDMETSATPGRSRVNSQTFSEPPAYDGQQLPNYEETTMTVIDPITGKPSTRDRRQNWIPQLIRTTSGLGVALSDRSLQSLKHTVSVLRGATAHIDSVMHALKLLLDEYESALRAQSSRDSSAMDTESHDGDSVGRDDQVRVIADRMKSLSADIWKTTQGVVKSVSTYTGGALPQNASEFVRTQLLSVQGRWRSAASSAGDTNGQGEEAKGAKVMLAFAKEGLDMIAQITTVVDGTVQSAETWLGRMGRERGLSLFVGCKVSGTFG
ncbi:clock-controlled protein-like protein 8 [Sporormia fimetaria CBS 119925]|uniref:Clock-controlled protein-like protein 8 n=1 Tax=Sporormia fimetaria CBS 119925 TaxID=1340428 RepID=A0A6A6UVN7_9PLEO|nr:clock-controlled protein-like protein 8 [Sporormia fimetaria CBS 119925]